MKQPMPNIHHNQGIVLFIALMFLFVSTLLGISSLRSNLLNEKMTLSTIQRAQAMEAAEVALLEGEQLVETYYSQIISGAYEIDTSFDGERAPTGAAKLCELQIDGAGGICVAKEQSDSPETRYDNWVDVVDPVTTSLNVWTNTGRHRVIPDIIKTKYGLLTSPKYIVEFMGFILDTIGETDCIAAGDLIELDGWPYCTQDIAQFRITVLATAGNYDETRVMLQSTYVVDI